MPPVHTERELRSANWHGLRPLAVAVLTLPGIQQLAHGVGRAVLPKHYFHRLPVAAPEVEFAMAGGQRIRLLNPRIDLVAKDIYFGNGVCSSPADLHVLRWLESAAPAADLFVDIGAYSCLFSLVAAAANPELRAIAFEIVPENFAMANANLIANDLLTRVELRLCGIGADQKIVRIPSVSGLSSRPTSVSLGIDAERGVSIPVRTLDSFGLEGRMIWKIDVEEFEWSVLRSAVETIRSQKPDIICEILPDAPNVEEIEALLKPLDYRFEIALDCGFEERERLVADPAGRDWLFTAGKKRSGGNKRRSKTQ